MEKLVGDDYKIFFCNTPSIESILGIPKIENGTIK
jgi:hypothetical protein